MGKGKGKGKNKGVEEKQETASGVPPWVDSFVRGDATYTVEEPSDEQISSTVGGYRSVPKQDVSKTGGYQFSNVSSTPQPGISTPPESRLEHFNELVEQSQQPWLLEGQSEAQGMNEHSIEEDPEFIHRKGSRTILGPAAEKQASDHEVRRINSLSCFRDAYGASNFDAVDEEELKPQYESKNLDVPVVIVTSEVNPFSKTGGLALVSQSYGIEFPRRGHRTMVISPMYDHYPNCEYIFSKRIWVMNGETEVKYFHTIVEHADGVAADYVFVDHPCYHRPGGLYYNAQEGVEYEDNLFRFALFSLAALEVPRMHHQYEERVVFLANDWQCALLPVYLARRHRPRGEYMDARCIFVVHNFGYQGIYPLNKLVPSEHGPVPVIVKNVGIEDLGLNPSLSNDLVYVYPETERQYEGDDGHVLNLTQAAILNADRILTVSPGYASEMQTAEGGFRLHDIVKFRKFYLGGILNGIDVTQWNPMNDPLLAAGYGPMNFLEGRAVCKKQLQERLGLQVNPHVALISFVGRLTDQKGIDIILESVDWLMENTGNNVTGHVQLILMGHGDKEHSEGLKSAEDRYRGSVCGYVGFDPQVEHIIYGGSDCLLMPSRYEPCGLPQMYASRYGCIPIVTLCGGLKDSVVTEPASEATGFGIWPLTLDKFKEVTYKALDTYMHKKNEFQEMQARAMVKDFSWCRALDQYEQHIDWALGDAPFGCHR